MYIDKICFAASKSGMQSELLLHTEKKGPHPAFIPAFAWPRLAEYTAYSIKRSKRGGDENPPGRKPSVRVSATGHALDHRGPPCLA